MGKPIHAPHTFKLQMQGRSEKKKMHTMMAKKTTTTKAFCIKTGLPCSNHSKILQTKQKHAEYAQHSQSPQGDQKSTKALGNLSECQDEY